VKPLLEHAVINLGNTIVKFTNSLLRSNIHRVISPPGLQADYTRYSLIYLNRPKDDVLLRQLKGSERIPPLAEGVVGDAVTSKDRIIRRALSSRPGLHGKEAFDYSRSRGTEAISQRVH
jgi:isopenicillin N synthase-like dioxygenase